MEGKRISERKIIISTGAFVIISGLIRIFFYGVGIVLFYLSFLPYIFYRVSYYYNKKGMEIDQLDKNRRLVLIGMVITLILNILGWQDANFFVLFLLMVDFLIVINKKAAAS
jgi:hypothetical protein